MARTPSKPASYPLAGRLLADRLAEAIAGSDQAGVARVIGVEPASLSRWTSGQKKAGKPGLRQLKRYFDQHQPDQDVYGAYLYLIDYEDGKATGEPPALAANYLPRLPDLHNLPNRNTDLTGRDDKVDVLTAALRQAGSLAAICAVDGMGGVGKTTLAIEAAHRLGAQVFPDGILVIELDGLAKTPPSTEDLMTRVLFAIDSDRQPPGNVPGAYFNELRNRRMLLIFDNARDREQVAPLQPPAPVSLLVTSRNRIDMAHATLLSLDKLEPPDADALLVKTLAGHSLEEPSRSELCRLCDYLPLAIVVIAAEIREEVRSVASIIRRLKEERAKGLNEVLHRLRPSIEALGVQHPEMLGRLAMLGIMPAGFNAAAAGAVWQTDEDTTEDTLRLLRRRSLLEAAPNSRREDPHFRLHDLIRDLITPDLTEESETTARRRHAHHFHQILKDADDLYLQGDPHLLTALQTFDQHRPHIEAAQSWATQNLETDPQAAQLTADFPNAGAYLIHLRLHPQTQITWLEAALTAARQLNNRQLEGTALGNLGIAHADLGDPQRAITYHEQNLAIAREIGDRRGEGNALGNLGIAHADLGDPQRAITYHEQDLTIAREIGDRRGEGNALNNLGLAHGNLGDPQRAITYYEQQLTIAREIGDRRGEGTALWNGALSYEKLGDLPLAIDMAKEAWRIRCEIENPNGPKVGDWLRKHGVEP